MQKSETIPLLVQEDFDDCPLIRDLLPLYLEGEVTPASCDMITTHLSDCASCATFLAGAQSMQSQLRHQPLQCATSNGKAAGITPKQPVAGIRSGVVAQPADPIIPVSNPWYLILDTIAVIGLCFGGFIVGAILMHIPLEDSVPWWGIGAISLWVVLHLNLIMAHKYGPITLGRLIILACGGILGAYSTRVYVEHIDPDAYLCLGAISFVLIWTAIFQGQLISSLSAFSTSINQPLGRSRSFIRMSMALLCIGMIVFYIM